MHKSDLIKAFAKKMSGNIQTDQATESINALTSVILDGLIQDGKVKIAGLGTFISGHRPARAGRNPRTGTPVDVPELTTVRFKVSPKIKSALCQSENG